MSTRGCVARLTNRPGSKKIAFKGSYLHWDNYPNGAGSTLFQLRNNHFKGDTKAMLKALIDDCPQGWSTINNADFNLPPAPRPDTKLEICKHCNLPNWRHYTQYYTETNEEWVKAGRPVCPSVVDGFRVANHTPEAIQKPHGPECYPASDDTSPITARNASSCGCEYVYAFDKDNRTMYVLSSYCSDDDSKKMIGMFGMGDPKATWKVIGEIDLDGVEPTEKQWDTVPIVQPEREIMTKEKFIKDISK